MGLTPGTRIGAYEVAAAIGAGGMGEVYLARDGRLHRDVALKIVSEAYAADTERLARFEREAQVLASLNHPNIAQIYGLEDYGNSRALVMEFVPGRTLAQVLASAGRALPPDEAFSIARQMADGLEAAHDRGIIHRDLKPGNVMLTDDDRVKILDFGLARMGETGASAGSDPADSPTLTMATHAGVILGTAGYMSPEQAKGRPADKRSDIWSFGCVLYEMLTGAPPFVGESVSDTLANVLKSDPDWSRLPVGLPSAIRVCLERCLIRDRHERIGDISTVKFLLAHPGSLVSAPTSSMDSPRLGPRRAMWILAAVALAAVTGFAAWQLKPDAAEPAVITRFQHALGEGQNRAVANRQAAISPDGTIIVYATDKQLYLRALSDVEAQPIAGTDSGPLYPTFSPDGKWVAYVDRGRATLKKIAVTGGTPVPLAQLPGGPGDLAWDHGIIAFGLNVAGQTGVYAVPEGGGALKQVAAVDPAIEVASQPFLVDATHVLFTLRRLELPAVAGGNSIVIQSIGGNDRKTLVSNGSAGQVLPTGQLVYVSDGSLRAVPFDARRLEVTRTPVALVAGVTGYSVARNGTFVYSTAEPASRVLVWVDRKGAETPIASVPVGSFDVRMSPDGKQLALCNAADIWIWTIDKETLTNLTLTPGAVEYNPAWTRDGRHVVFDSSDGGARNIQIRAVDGTGSATLLAAAPGYPETISADGRLLVYHTQANVAMLQPLDPAGPARPLVPAKGQVLNAHISPDGRWIAYQSDESGRFEIYVRPFPATETGRWQISPAGGAHPLWASSGRELFFIDAAGVLTAVAVPVQTAPAFTWGKLVGLFPAGQYYVNVARDYDVTLDGTRFVFVKIVANSGARPSFTVVTNWLEEVRSRMAIAARP